MKLFPVAIIAKLAQLLHDFVHILNLFWLSLLEMIVTCLTQVRNIIAVRPRTSGLPRGSAAEQATAPVIWRLHYYREPCHHENAVISSCIRRYILWLRIIQ